MDPELAAREIDDFRQESTDYWVEGVDDLFGELLDFDCEDEYIPDDGDFSCRPHDGHNCINCGNCGGWDDEPDPGEYAEWQDFYDGEADPRFDIDESLDLLSL